MPTHPQHTAPPLSSQPILLWTSFAANPITTDYNYFGARYYDSELSIWLSVDPLADKYPSMSAYMYTAGNPVMLVDPDGREPLDINSHPRLNFKAKLLRLLPWYWGEKGYNRLMASKHCTCGNQCTKGKKENWFLFGTQKVTITKYSKVSIDDFSIDGRKAIPFSRNVDIEIGGTVTFESYQKADQLIIQDNAGNPVFNSGSISTNGNPITVQLGPGSYRIIVNPSSNPNQISGVTMYDVSLNETRGYNKVIREVWRLWGFIPYKWKTLSRDTTRIRPKRMRNVVRSDFKKL